MWEGWGGVGESVVGLGGVGESVGGLGRSCRKCERAGEEL